LAKKNESKSFEDDMAERQKVGIAERLGENAPPPGLGADGNLNIVNEDDPPWTPQITTPEQLAEQDEEDYSDLQD